MYSIEELLRRSVILIDKPSGPTCRKVDENIKLILKRKKTGHSGTLDSKVTGLLIVALDEAAKIMPFLMRSNKTYEGIIHLHDDFDIKKLKKIVKENCYVIKIIFNYNQVDSDTKFIYDINSKNYEYDDGQDITY